MESNGASASARIDGVDFYAIISCVKTLKDPWLVEIFNQTTNKFFASQTFSTESGAAAWAKELIKSVFRLGAAPKEPIPPRAPHYF